MRTHLSPDGGSKSPSLYCWWRPRSPGVFAGGDAVRGPDLVVTALRDGRRAAEAIDRYLRRQLEEVIGPDEE